MVTRKTAKLFSIVTRSNRSSSTSVLLSGRQKRSQLKQNLRCCSSSGDSGSNEDRSSDQQHSALNERERSSKQPVHEELENR